MSRPAGAHCARPACGTAFPYRPAPAPRTRLFCFYCAFPSGLQGRLCKAPRSCTVLRMSKLPSAGSRYGSGLHPAGMAHLSGMYLSLACIGKRQDAVSFDGRTAFSLCLLVTRFHQSGANTPGVVAPVRLLEPSVSTCQTCCYCWCSESAATKWQRQTNKPHPLCKAVARRAFTVPGKGQLSGRQPVRSAVSVPLLSGVFRHVRVPT